LNWKSFLITRLPVGTTLGLCVPGAAFDNIGLVDRLILVAILAQVSILHRDMSKRARTKLGIGISSGVINSRLYSGVITLDRNLLVHFCLVRLVVSDGGHVDQVVVCDKNNVS